MVREDGRVNFEELEAQKENVVVRQGGRSAGLLLDLQRNPLRVKEAQMGFQQQLSKLPQMEDPLQFFLEYIDWSEHAWTQGPTLKASGMLEVVETCLLYCQSFEKYLNNLDYVKLWLRYIKLFTANTTEQRDLFIYMFRRKIGVKLANFYDKFSELLLEMEKLQEAYKIIKFALKNNVDNVDSLSTTFEYIKSLLNESTGHRDELDQLFSDSNRPTILDREYTLIRLEYNERQTQKSRTQPANKNFVYQDDSDDGYLDDNLVTDETVPSTFQVKSERDKENKRQIEPIVPTISLNPLKQSENFIEVSKPKGKMNIFNDSTNNRTPVFKLIYFQDGKKPEKIDCNFELLYDSQDSQTNCIEEILAISRGIRLKKGESDELKHSEKKRKI